MSDPTPRLTPGEERELRKAMDRGETPLCPRCRRPLEVVPVPPSSQVAYVRRRALLTCGPCGLTIPVDR